MFIFQDLGLEDPEELGTKNKVPKIEDPRLVCPACKGKLTYLRMQDYCEKCKKLVFRENGIVRLKEP